VLPQRLPGRLRSRAVPDVVARDRTAVTLVDAREALRSTPRTSRPSGRRALGSETSRRRPAGTAV